ncbi:MAG: hypothetical protein ACK56F_20070, partial [bacterium]
MKLGGPACGRPRQTSHTVSASERVSLGVCLPGSVSPSARAFLLSLLPTPLERLPWRPPIPARLPPRRSR